MKKVYSFIIFALIIVSGYSQDPHFSQFYSNPLYLNPAMAGANVCPRLNLNYRNQWPSIPTNFVTYSVSYDQHVNMLHGGLGLLFVGDNAGSGTLKTNNIGGMYSYKLTINRSMNIAAGISVSYVQKNLDWTNLTFPDQIDPRYGFVYNTNETPPSELSKSFVDFASGIIGYTEKFYLGFSANHLTRPNEGLNSYTRMPIRYSVHAGGKLSLESWGSHKKGIKQTSLSPNIIFMQQGTFQQLNYGMYLNKYPFVGGLWFRQSFTNPDALIFLLGVQQQQFKVGYSYDLTVSKLTNATGGAHEISFTYFFPCPERKVEKIRPIHCPSF